MAIPDPISPRSIGERIRHTRKTRGLSQADLAKRIGVSQPAIANWESGLHDPRRVVLAKLADVLDAPVDWLAAGARSMLESDTHAAAAYLRRGIYHVPVISFENAARLALEENADPHTMAEDYIVVTGNSNKVFAVFVTDDTMNRIFVRDTLVVIDYADKSPTEGGCCLVLQEEGSVLRRWNPSIGKFETYSSDPNLQDAGLNGETMVIGCARVSIRLH